MADPLDFTDRYNTPLDPQNEVLYQAWLRDQSQAAGRDMSNDAYNYDMRGAFLGGAGRADNNHWPDTFKKPNHPSFSSQSMYHGADGHMGGQWGGQDGIWRGTWIKIWPVTATDTQPDAPLCLYRLTPPLTPLRAQQAATVSNREQTNQLI